MVTFFFILNATRISGDMLMFGEVNVWDWRLDNFERFLQNDADRKGYYDMLEVLEYRDYLINHIKIFIGSAVL